MKLTVLVDNNAIIDSYFLAEPALSFYIEDGNKKILFDAGYSNAFLLNADKMGIDLSTLDYVVLSHGHLDHTWGLKHLIKFLNKSKKKKRPVLIAHPLAFKTKTHKTEGNIGSQLTEKALSKNLKLHLCAEPVWLTKKLVFLGQIPRKFSYEGKKSIGFVQIADKKTADTLLDDSAIAYKAKRGITIITGCSHAGICNIVEHARCVCKTKKVSCIIGGLHLLNPNKKQLNGTLKYLKSLKSVRLSACHCTDLKSKFALSRVVTLEEIGVGSKIEVE
jgi:7,8-dihydropterin-6-yl-methyl-4-(beta-D-ribofuranosyl)aminobenzene 5'-phosphate synthase